MFSISNGIKEIVKCKKNEINSTSNFDKTNNVETLFCDITNVLEKHNYDTNSICQSHRSNQSKQDHPKNSKNEIIGEQDFGFGDCPN